MLLIRSQVGVTASLEFSWNANCCNHRYPLPIWSTDATVNSWWCPKAIRIPAELPRT